jgi:hypothetical protein
MNQQQQFLCQNVHAKSGGRFSSSALRVLLGGSPITSILDLLYMIETFPSNDKDWLPMLNSSLMCQLLQVSHLCVMHGLK